MSQINLRQTCAFAMQYAIVMGVWHIIALALAMMSLQNESYSLLSLVMGIGSFLLAIALTKRFRKQIASENSFSISHGFIYALLLSLFASLWVAVFVYGYMQFADNSWIFEAYRQRLADPQVIEALQSTMKDEIVKMTGSEEPISIVDFIEGVPPMTYAASVLYGNMLIAPILSLIIGIICKK